MKLGSVTEAIQCLKIGSSRMICKDSTINDCFKQYVYEDFKQYSSILFDFGSRARIFLNLLSCFHIDETYEYKSEFSNDLDESS